MAITKETKEANLLEVKNLKILFKTDEGIITAVDGIDFSVKRGQTLGIVGESGSGKSLVHGLLCVFCPKTQSLIKTLPLSFIVKAEKLLK